MFQFVKKLRSLKKPLNRLNWQNENVFEKVVMLKDKLREWQSKIDINPSKNVIRKEGIEI